MFEFVLVVLFVVEFVFPTMYMAAVGKRRRRESERGEEDR